jgi:hypothetical protein
VPRGEHVVCDHGHDMPVRPRTFMTNDHGLAAYDCSTNHGKYRLLPVLIADPNTGAFTVDPKGRYWRGLR